MGGTGAIEQSLAQRTSEILDAWAAEAQRAASARGMSWPALMNVMPKLLSAIVRPGDDAGRRDEQVGMRETRTFSATELRRIEAIGEGLSLHLDNARLYAELLERIELLQTRSRMAVTACLAGATKTVLTSGSARGTGRARAARVGPRGGSLSEQPSRWRTRSMSARTHELGAGSAISADERGNSCTSHGRRAPGASFLPLESPS